MNINAVFKGVSHVDGSEIQENTVDMVVYPIDFCRFRLYLNWFLAGSMFPFFLGDKLETRLVDAKVSKGDLNFTGGG